MKTSVTRPWEPVVSYSFQPPPTLVSSEHPCVCTIIYSAVLWATTPPHSALCYLEYPDPSPPQRPCPVA